jgi:hypothetical protein
VVQNIATKFPEWSGSPCPDHITLATGDLLGDPVPLNGRIPLQGGRTVRSGSRVGVVFDESPEALAFARWQRGEFRELERVYAAGLRRNLTSLDLSEPKKALQSLGATGKTIKTLQQARTLADEIVNGSGKEFERLRLAILFFEVPPRIHQSIVERWDANGRPTIRDFAPYTAFALTVEIFFQIAVGADLISSARPSNRMDIAYLFYLPFSHIFVSSDKLHRKCAPLFMRDSQEFVWGPDLKADLGRINAYYLTLPEEERDKGLNVIAHEPPKEGNYLTAQIYDRMNPDWRTYERIAPLPAPDSKKLVGELMAFTNSKDIISDKVGAGEDYYQTMSIQRRVHKRKGSWWQLPKDLPDQRDL